MITGSTYTILQSLLIVHCGYVTLCKGKISDASRSASANLAEGNSETAENYTTQSQVNGKQAWKVDPERE